MKKVTLLTVTMLLTLAAQAQRMVIGSKVPDLKKIQWLGNTPPSGKSSFIEFYQSTNSTSKQYFPKLKDIRNYNSNINIIVLTRENNDAIAELVREHGSEYYFGYDPQGDVFTSFGVKFVPFSMAVDPKGNLQWQGNLLQFTPDIMKTMK